MAVSVASSANVLYGAVTVPNLIMYNLVKNVTKFDNGESGKFFYHIENNPQIGRAHV